MTCRETANLLPRFFDGELDARQMRAVALHGTRCATCEDELRRMERLQELIDSTINARVDEIDLTTFWPAIERQLGTVRPSMWQRLRAQWAEREFGWSVGLPAFAAAAAIAIFAFLVFTRGQQPTTQPAASQVAAVEEPASIDSLDTDVDSVAVMSDPETRTTVLWVSDDTVVGGEAP